MRSSGRILIKASGLVENNDLDRLTSIMVNPEVPEGAAVGIQEVVIRNNRLNEALCNTPSSAHPAGAISVTARGNKHSFLPAGAIGRILIEGNTVQKGNGATVVVTSTCKVEIRNNTFKQPQQVAPSVNGADLGVDNHAVVWLAQCDEVVLQGNQILNPGSFISQPLVRGAEVKQIEGALSVGPLSVAVPLSSLGLEHAKQYGFWNLSPGHTFDKHTPTVHGVEDKLGISSRGEMVAAFDLKGSAGQFTAEVGVDDEVREQFKGPAECRVYGDGKLLWSSGPLKSDQAPVKLDVDLHGVKILELVVHAFGNEIAQTHVDWLNAMLHFTGEKPVNIQPPTLASKPEIRTPPSAPTPRINGARVFGVRPGSPVLFTSAATGDRPMKVSVTGLPEGLPLNSENGQISGVLNEPGEHRVTLQAVNALGAAERQLRIVVGDQISLSPPMGWSSWNCWASDVDQDKVLRAAHALVGSGLAQHGFTFVNVDDAWQAKRGGPFNAVQGNDKFPDMKAMCGEIHQLGLKAGIYSTPWVQSYAGFPGGSSDFADGHFEKLAKDVKNHIGAYFLLENDVKQWDKWGFDYLKCDWFPPKPEEARRVAQALLKSPRDIIFSVSCDAPFKEAAGYPGVANSWRTTTDIIDTWQTLSGIAFSQDRWAPFGGPGHWPDPDMMEVGQVRSGKETSPSRLTPDEQYLHMTAWCLLSAPLILGCDLEKLDAFTLGLLTNDEVLDLDQDPLGKPARCLVRKGELQVWVKELEDGSKAVGFFNLGREELKAQVDWSELGLKGDQSIRDLWSQTDLGKFKESFETRVNPHGVRLVRMMPVVN